MQIICENKEIEYVFDNAYEMFLNFTNIQVYTSSNTNILYVEKAITKNWYQKLQVKHNLLHRWLR